MSDNIIMKKDWNSSFNIVGKAMVNDYTFKIDQHSDKSDWVYNSMNLGIDCGEKYGAVYVESMGGYPEEREPFPIRVHGKDSDGRDDFTTMFEVAWEDRLDENIMEECGELCFITVGLEKTSKGNTFYKKFLSEYDAIKYASEHLAPDMVVRVKGNLKYSMYNENVQVRKEVKSIVLSEIDDPSKYSATFMQTVLLDNDSASLKNIDEDKGVMYIDAIVLDYMKEYNGKTVKDVEKNPKSLFPFSKQFEYEMDFSKPELCKKIYDKLFKVKKGITQVTFEGIFVEGGATVQTTIDDVPEELRELMEIGIISEEEAIAKCSTSGPRERRMVFVKPYIKKVGEGDEVHPVIQVFPERFDEEDLILPCMADGCDETPWAEEATPESSDDDSAEAEEALPSWLDDL